MFFLFLKLSQWYEIKQNVSYAYWLIRTKLLKKTIHCRNFKYNREKVNSEMWSTQSQPTTEPKMIKISRVFQFCQPISHSSMFIHSVSFSIINHHALASKLVLRSWNNILSGQVAIQNQKWRGTMGVVLESFLLTFNKYSLSGSWCQRINYSSN